MVMKQGWTRLTTLALVQWLNSSPALRLHCGAYVRACLAGLIKCLEEGGEAWSTAANTPMSPVSLDPLRLTCTVVNPDMMRRKSSP